MKYPGNGLPDVRGMYGDKNAAMRYFGCYSWEEELKRCFGVEEVSEAEDGDLVWYKAGGVECIHYVHEGQVYSVDLRRGLLHWNIGLLDRGYKIYRLCQQPYQLSRQYSLKQP